MKTLKFPTSGSFFVFHCIIALLVYLHKLGQPKIKLFSQRRFAGNLCPISLGVQSTSE